MEAVSCCCHQPWGDVQRGRKRGAEVCRKLPWRRGMAEKALHYDATCHHFRVTVMTRGHALLPKQPSPAQGLSQPGWVGAKGLLPGPCRFCQHLGCVSHQQPTSQAGWEENLLLVSRASTFDLEKSEGRCQLPRKSFAWSRCGQSLLQEPTSLSAQLGGHRG